MANRRILFVTWDGPQVRYLEGLFVPIFAGLKAHGHEVFVLQFTWGPEGGADDACRAAGIGYRRVEVERRFGGPGAFLTAFAGGHHVDSAVTDWDIDLLLPRSLMPALAVMRSASGHRLPILFDADGLPADERVEFGGLGPRGPTYRVLRWIEARMVRRADHVMVRTEAAAKILAARAGPRDFAVVTNGRAPTALPVEQDWPRSDPSAPRLVYAGSLGRQYRPDAMLDLVLGIRQRLPGLTLDLFTGDLDAALALVERAGLANSSWLTIDSLAPSDLADRLPHYDAGLALRAASVSMSAVAPIKIGDYLMAGLPIIGTAGIGEVDELIAADVMLAVTDDDSERAADWLAGHVIPDRRAVRRTARELGERLFSLSRSVDLYDRAIAATPVRTG